MSQYIDSDPAKRLTDENTREIVFRLRTIGQSNSDSSIDTFSDLAGLECEDWGATQVGRIAAILSRSRPESHGFIRQPKCNSTKWHWERCALMSCTFVLDENLEDLEEAGSWNMAA